MMPTSERCTFTFWRPHYAMNVYIAVNEWLRQNPSMKGTAVGIQMEEIRDKAKTAFNASKPSERAIKP